MNRERHKGHVVEVVPKERPMVLVLWLPMMNMLD